MFPALLAPLLLNKVRMLTSAKDADVGVLATIKRNSSCRNSCGITNRLQPNQIRNNGHWPSQISQPFQTDDQLQLNFWLKNRTSEAVALRSWVLRVAFQGVENGWLKTDQHPWVVKRPTGTSPCHLFHGFQVTKSSR